MSLIFGPLGRLWIHNDEKRAHRNPTPNMDKAVRAGSLLLLNMLIGVFAGMIYSSLERSGEVVERTERARLASLLKGEMNDTMWELALTVFDADSQTLEADMAAYANSSMEEELMNWDATGGMFFAFTVATSIGYGTFAPKTPGGRLFTCLHAIISIPLMLAAFTSLMTVLLKACATKLAGRKRDLPVKTFRMMDRDRSGTLDRKETVSALKLMGLGHYDGPLSTLDKRRRFQEAWEISDKKKTGHLRLQEFRLLLNKLLPGEDEAMLFVDVTTRAYIALTSIISFVMFVFISTSFFSYEYTDWSLTDSFYFTTMTFLTVGLGDLAPEPHPWYFMITWVIFTFLGLGFTTSMVQAVTSPDLNMGAAFRGCCPTVVWGTASAHEITTGRLSGVTGGKKYRAFRKRLSVAAGVPGPMSNATMKNVLGSKQTGLKAAETAAFAAASIKAAPSAAAAEREDDEPPAGPALHPALRVSKVSKHVSMREAV